MTAQHTETQGTPGGGEELPATTTVGLNSQTLRAPGFLDGLDAAHHVGFTAVELTGAELDPYLESPEALRSELAGRSLALVGVCPAPDLMGWHHAWDAELAGRLCDRLWFYRELGAAYLVMPIMSDEGDPVSARRGLEAAAAVATETGVGLAVESIGHVPKLRRLEEVRALIDSVDAGDLVGLALDSFHFFRAGHELADLALLDGLQVWVAQLSNAVDKPRDQLVGYRDRTFPLDGIFDVAGFRDALERSSPGVPITAEVLGEVPWSLSPEEAARRAHTQLHALQIRVVEAR